MKILVLTPTFLPALGGAELVILQVFRRLARRHAVMVLTPSLDERLLAHSASAEYDDLVNFEVLRYRDRVTLMKVRGHRISRGLLPPFSLSAVGAIRAAAAAFKPDVINVHYVMPTGLAGLYAQTIVGIPVVITYNGRDVPGPGVPWCWKYWHRLVGKRCADMTFVSRYCREVIYGQRSRCGHIIYNGVENAGRSTAEGVRFVKSKWQIENHGPILFALQRLDYLKRVDVLLRCMPDILAVWPQTCLIIGGQGEDLQRLRQIAAEMGVAGNVIFTGYIPASEIPAYFALADVFVFHSTFETFGMVLVEAMNFGKAIVSVKDTAISEVIDDGETGLLANGLDHKGFAEAVLKILEDRNLQRRLGVNAGRKARTHFGWDFISTEYERIFENVVSSSAVEN